ncbi:twin-arginine translocase subunit TatB [Halomonas sp. SF2003]|nr:twin-arginine translocase subunit TatB [Halomonas sp. SF2003]
MFDIGFFELALIALLALIVLGPERLPRAARTAGLWLGRIKRSVSGIQQEISAQLEAEELRQTLNEQKKQLDETLAHARNEARDVERGITESSTSRDAGASGAETSPRPAENGAQATEPSTASDTRESREPRS